MFSILCVRVCVFMQVVVSSFKDGSPNKEVRTFLDAVYIQYVPACIHGGGRLQFQGWFTKRGSQDLLRYSILLVCPFMYSWILVPDHVGYDCERKCVQSEYTLPGCACVSIKIACTSASSDSNAIRACLIAKHCWIISRFRSSISLTCSSLRRPPSED